MEISNNVVIALVGPTAVGKSTLERALVAQGCTRMVSLTTRQPRAGEVHGVDYFFVTEAEFENSEAVGELIEQVEYAGNLYGLSSACVWAALDNTEAKATVVVCDPSGLGQLRKFLEPKGIKVFGVYLHQSLRVLISRVLDRYRRDVEAGKESVEDYYAERIFTMMSDFPNWPYMGVYNLRVGPEVLAFPPERIASTILETALRD